MINTLVNGVLSVSIHILDFFLSPIENLIYSSGLGDNYNSFVNAFMSTMANIRAVLPWVIDATGIPKPIFSMIFTVFLAGIILRLSVFIIKWLVKWWDRIVA